MLNLELHTAIEHIREAALSDGSKIGLQLPEGLVADCSAIMDDLSREFPTFRFVILANVVYGACCIDDVAAYALDCSLLLHFGHSELVSSDRLLVPTRYVRVTIDIDTDKLIAAASGLETGSGPVHLLSTAQYLGALPIIAAKLEALGIPAVMPATPGLAPGEILGCTCPVLPPAARCLVICDGRFHVEAIGKAVPDAVVYKFDPFLGRVLREHILPDTDGRVDLVDRTRAAVADRGLGRVGFLLGTLGRQGSVPLLRRLQGLVARRGGVGVTVAMAIMDEDRVRHLADGLDMLVLLSCPRLALDWGQQFEGLGMPVLTANEFYGVLDNGVRDEMRGGYPLRNYDPGCVYTSSW